MILVIWIVDKIAYKIIKINWKIKIKIKMKYQIIIKQKESKQK